MNFLSDFFADDNVGNGRQEVRQTLEKKNIILSTFNKTHRIKTEVIVTEYMIKYSQPWVNHNIQ